MRLISAMKKIAFPAIGCALALFASPEAFGQAGIICPEKSFSDLVVKPTVSTGSASLSSSLTDSPDEQAAYKAFSRLKTDNADKRIGAGEAFLKKYPLGPFSQIVYSRLTFAEYQQNNFIKMDEYANKALALNPDDLEVLVLIGWVIPHAADADPAQLEKAEKYEKHVLELLPTVVKTAGMTDQELTAAKSQYESQAHSGLGLVDYDRNDFNGAVAEMKRAVSGISNPDPSDYFVLGDSLYNLDRYSEAADAFKSCAAIAGSQQPLCKRKEISARRDALAHSGLTASTAP